MEKLGIDRVYASALIDVAIERGKLDSMTEELEFLDKVFKDNEELLSLLREARISKSEKHQIISNIFENKLSEEVLNFMFVLADNNRFYCFKDIIKSYKKMIDEKNGFETGVVYSVKKLGKETLLNLENELGRAFGESIKLENRIDPKLIGGIKVYVAGKLVDASYKTGLEKIRKSLLA